MSLRKLALLSFSCMTCAAHAAELSGWYWEDRVFHISTGDLSSTSVGPEDWQAAFATAASRWQDDDVPFLVTTDGSTQLESCDFNDPNTAYFSADACGQSWPQNVVGIAVTWSESASGAAAQSSILFNSNESWSVYDGPPQVDADFTRVAAHEIGHSIGLGHTTTDGALMEPVASDTIVPQADDISAVNVIYNIPGAVVLPDIDNDGSDELVALRARLPARQARAQIRDIANGSRQRSFSYFDGYRPLDAFLIDDRNNNGVDEVAVLQRRNSDGRTLLEARDPSTGGLAWTVFFSPNHEAIAGATIADVNNNQVQEGAVLMTRNSDEDAIVQIRDLATKALLRNLFYRPNSHPVDMAIVPDTNGNGSDEVAVLLVRKSDLRALVQIRDSATGATISNIWLPSGLTAHNVLVVADTNSNNQADIATLVQRDSDGLIGVRVADSVTAASLNNTWYRPAGSDIFARHALQRIPDTNGNGTDEIALITQQTSTQRTVFQFRESQDGTQLGTFFISPDYDAERMVVVPSLNGNNSPEVGMFGFSASGQTEVRFYDTDTGSKPNTLYYPNLQ